MLKQAVPKDANAVSLPLTPSVNSVAVTNSASLSSALTVTLNAATSFLEINALTQGIFLRWGAVPTSSAFDEYIQAGFTRHYVVPINAATGLPYATVQFLEQSATARLILIEK